MFGGGTGNFLTGVRSLESEDRREFRRLNPEFRREFSEQNPEVNSVNLVDLVDLVDGMDGREWRAGRAVAVHKNLVPFESLWFKNTWGTW